MGHFINKYSVGIPITEVAYWESYFIKSLLTVAVNVFVLISGYYSISFKLSKILKLGWETWFYSVTLFILAIVMGWHDIQFVKDIAYFVPILSKVYWFITIYVILSILSPILNKMSLSLSKREFKSILIIGFFIIYVWHTLCFILNFGMPIDDAGYGIPNFLFLYLCGRYIKLHCDLSSMKLNFLFCYACICFSLFIFQLLYSLLLGFSFTSLLSYNTIFIFGGALSLFLFFAKKRISHNKLINGWAKNCLAVYIIHMHPLCWNKICELL